MDAFEADTPSHCGRRGVWWVAEDFLRKPGRLQESICHQDTLHKNILKGLPTKKLTTHLRNLKATIEEDTNQGQCRCRLQLFTTYKTKTK